MKYILTDEDIEAVAEIVRDKLYEKGSKRGGDASLALSGAADAVMQMIPFQLKKIAKEIEE